MTLHTGPVFPSAPRDFGRRDVAPIVADHSVERYNAVAGQNIEYTDPRREYDFFVSDPHNECVSGWNYQGTFTNVHKAFRAQNMVRVEFPHLKCKIMHKPRLLAT